MLYPVGGGCITFSSGTTGTPKRIWHSRAKINSALKVYKRTHDLDSSSRVLNFLSLDHIGGLMMDLSGKYVGAEVSNIQFNVYKFLDELKEYSHTMLPDSSITALRKTKNFTHYNFSNKFIHCGTEPHTKENIRALVERGATVFCNWGMTEIGPICIHTTFKPHDVDSVERYFAPGALLGDNFEIEWKIDDGELVVRSPMSIYKDWHYTGDIVNYENNTLYYIRRR